MTDALDRIMDEHDRRHKELMAKWEKENSLGAMLRELPWWYWVGVAISFACLAVVFSTVIYVAEHFLAKVW